MSEEERPVIDKKAYPAAFAWFAKDRDRAPGNTGFYDVLEIEKRSEYTPERKTIWNSWVSGYMKARRDCELELTTANANAQLGWTESLKNLDDGGHNLADFWEARNKLKQLQDAIKGGSYLHRCKGVDCYHECNIRQALLESSMDISS